MISTRSQIYGSILSSTFSKTSHKVGGIINKKRPDILVRDVRAIVMRYVREGQSDFSAAPSFLPSQPSLYLDISSKDIENRSSETQLREQYERGQRKKTED